RPAAAGRDRHRARAPAAARRRGAARPRPPPPAGGPPAPAPGAGRSRLQRLHPRLHVRADAGGDDRLQVSVEHLVEVVGLVAGAVVGDAVFREVVGADPLGAVDGADLAAPRLAVLRVARVLGGGEETGAQDAHRRLLVLQLALLVLAAG